MKSLLVTVLVLIFSSARANPRAVIKNWNHSISLTQQQVVDELEAVTSFWFFVGDDGVQCEGQIYALELIGTQANPSSKIVGFQIAYEAEVYGGYSCFEEQMDCKASFRWSDDENYFLEPKVLCN